MRLFFAIELPSQVQAVLGRLKVDDPDYRWVDPALLHLTLAFLGEQPTDKLDLLQRTGASVASTSGRGVLRLGQAGQFGGKRAPRVLWVDVTGDVEKLLLLQRELSASLDRAGFPMEERAYTPHITLARRRETAHGGPPPGWPPIVKATPFKMTELTLMQSRLSPRGPTYTPIEHFPIGS